jgi:lipid-A-disaccharide synthase
MPVTGSHTSVMNVHSAGGRDLTVMMVAGEPSGDLLAAELVSSLRAAAPGRPIRIFGAGGARMAAAGVEIDVDMTAHAIVGLAEAVVRYRVFRKLFNRLVALARARRPDVIVCVDFSGFNRRFARTIRATTAYDAEWRPRIVQYVSPQVWASRPGRARTMARDLDLLITIFPFEQAWYAQHAPSLRVTWAGHPLVDRYGAAARGPVAAAGVREPGSPAFPRILLLPGSRPSELARHLPVMLEAADLIGGHHPSASFRIVAPDDRLLGAQPAAAREGVRVTRQAGGLAAALAEADLAIASTGTVTLECAWFGVPTVAMYKTSWLTYHIGRRLVTVRHLAMPNLIAGQAVVPELVQDEATGTAIAGQALGLLAAPEARRAMRRQLGEVVAALGPAGASRRAAEAILEIV